MRVIGRAAVQSVPALLLLVAFLLSWAAAGHVLYGTTVGAFSSFGRVRVAHCCCAVSPAGHRVLDIVMLVLVLVLAVLVVMASAMLYCR